MRSWLAIPAQLTFPFQVSDLFVQPLAILFIESRPDDLESAAAMVSGQAEFLANFVRSRQRQICFGLFVFQTRGTGFLQSLNRFDRRFGVGDGLCEAAVMEVIQCAGIENQSEAELLGHFFS